MAHIDAIKQLRDQTGLSFNEIRRALDEAVGDESKALELLKLRGAHIAQKKSSRSTGEGIIEAYVHATKKVGVLVELLCETDFVARNPLFIELAHECALHIAAMDPQTIEEFIAQPFVKDPALTVGQMMSNYVAKLGENIKVHRFQRFAI